MARRRCSSSLAALMVGSRFSTSSSAKCPWSDQLASSSLGPNRALRSGTVHQVTRSQFLFDPIRTSVHSPESQGSADRTIRLWDIRKRTQLHVFQPMEGIGPIHHLDVGIRGDRFLCCDSNGAVCLYSADQEDSFVSECTLYVRLLLPLTLDGSVISRAVGRETLRRRRGGYMRAVLSLRAGGSGVHQGVQAVLHGIDSPVLLCEPAGVSPRSAVQQLRRVLPHRHGRHSLRRDLALFRRLRVISRR